ncbi:MAG: hypothetical protein PVF08_02050 [Gammaproteobacteria bacterium]|jgi:hypothetical protein
MKVTTETFFRPDEIARERVKLPATLFNRCLLLLHRSTTDNVFVPIRSMQYQAVIDSGEIIFVDNHGYAVSNGHGGRLIVLAWDMAGHASRSALNEPVPMEIVYYSSGGHEIHRRLMSEFPRALDSHESRLREAHTQDRTASILPFSGNRSN